MGEAAHEHSVARKLRLSQVRRALIHQSEHRCDPVLDAFSPPGRPGGELTPKAKQMLKRAASKRRRS